MRIANSSGFKLGILGLVLVALLFADSYRLLKPQRAEIIASDGVVIVGSFYPVKTANPPAVILLHMLGRNRGDWNEYARFLQKADIAVLSVDLRGHGESTNRRTLNWRFFKHDQYQQMIDDLEPIYHYLTESCGVNPNKVGLLGMNLGANIGLNYAARKTEIASVALISPSLDYKGVQTAESAQKYHARPLYVICEKNDKESCQAAEEFKKNASGKFKLDIYDNYGISGIYLFNQRVSLYKNISSWFAQTLI